MGRRRIIALLVALSFAHSLLYALIMPPWQIPDEPFYFAAAQQQAARLGATHQPALIAPAADEPTPLYFALAAPLVGTVGDPIVTMYLLRVASALLGALIVLLGVLTAWTLFPGDDLVALCTGLVLSLLPMVGQFSAEVAPDVLANVAGALVFWAGVAIVVRGWRVVPAITVVAALAVGVAAKRDALALVGPVLALPLFALAAPRRDPEEAPSEGRRWLRLAAVTGSLGVFAGVAIGNEIGGAAGVWAPLAVLTPGGWWRTLADLATDRPANLSLTFWGRWGWNPPYAVQIDPWLVACFRTLSAVALIGLAVLAVKLWRRRGQLGVAGRLAGTGFLAVGAWASVLATVIYGGGLGSAQSKWLYPALVPIVLLAVAGLAALPPAPARRVGLLVAGGLLAFYDAAALWRYVVPHYYEAFPGRLIQSHLNVWLKTDPLQRFSFHLAIGARPAILHETFPYAAVQLALWLLLAAVLAGGWRRMGPDGRGAPETVGAGPPATQ